jgi:hypothetical protein
MFESSRYHTHSLPFFIDLFSVEVFSRRFALLLRYNIERERERGRAKMMILCRLFCQGFLGLFSSLFPSLLFFALNAFFSSQEKNNNNIVSLFLFLSFSLSLFRRCLDDKRARERRRERESFGDDENTVYE